MTEVSFTEKWKRELERMIMYKSWVILIQRVAENWDSE